MFHGSIPALITPFRDGSVDFDAISRLVDWHVAEGSAGIVAVGTTGESPTLSHDEHRAVVEAIVSSAAGRIPVIAGAGSNSTSESVDFIRHAERVGADAALVVTPYYNKPTQAGLVAHYRAVHDASSLPILIYNIPGRSAVDMDVATMAELADLPRIIGVKDATAKLDRVALQRRHCGPEFLQLSGEDATAVAFNALGGKGCISVTANVAPRLCAEMQAATLAGDFAQALSLHDRLMPLHEAIFSEPGLVGVKFAMAELGLCSAEVRLPLTPASAESAEQIRAALREAGLRN